MSVRIDESFIQLINENIGIAHKIGRAYIPDPVERQDAIQEMMYQLWRSFPGFDHRSKFSTWMYRVCLNTVLTYTRKSQEKRTLPLSHLHTETSVQADTSTDEDVRRLFDAIGTLSDLNKAVVLLYLEDMSYEEIAAVTGISRSNVSVRLVRIKKELAVLLKEKV